jgi:hypothetical protein
MTTWVFAAGMRRSGSTMQYLLARDIVAHAGGIDLGWIIWQDFQHVFGLNGHTPFAILKCHAYFPSHSAKGKWVLDFGNFRALHIYRDARDVAVSLSRFLKGLNRDKDFDDVIADLIGAIAENRAWSSLPADKLHIARYEDVWYDWEIEARQIADFLQIEIKNKELTDIVDRYDLHKQTTRTETLPVRTRDAEDTQLWHHHIGPACPGQWKTMLTEKQLERVYEVAKPWLDQHGYL